MLPMVPAGRVGCTRATTPIHDHRPGWSRDRARVVSEAASSRPMPATTSRRAAYAGPLRCHRGPRVDARRLRHAGLTAGPGAKPAAATGAPGPLLRSTRTGIKKAAVPRNGSSKLQRADARCALLLSPNPSDLRPGSARLLLFLRRRGPGYCSGDKQPCRRRVRGGVQGEAPRDGDDVENVGIRRAICLGFDQVVGGKFYSTWQPIQGGLEDSQTALVCSAFCATRRSTRPCGLGSRRCSGLRS
jgi:hypothetical protein